MRFETKRAYEKRIEVLLEKLGAALIERDKEISQSQMWKDSYFGLKDARRQGEESRQWAIEQAIYAGQTANIVKAAKQIADFVYGPDVTADSEAESPS